jgi:DNA-binding beta-propeller fold protein YncE
MRNKYVHGALGVAVALVSLHTGCNGSNEPIREGLSYPGGDLTFTQGKAITPQKPNRVRPGAVFGAVPALPAGLVLDPATGVISGTPTEASPKTEYQITARNAAGTERAILFLTVVARDAQSSPDGGGDPGTGKEVPPRPSPDGPPGSTPVMPAGSNPVVPAGSNPVVPARPHPVAHAEPVPVVPSRPHPVAYAEPVLVVPSRPHPVVHAEPVPVVPSRPYPVVYAEPVPGPRLLMPPVPAPAGGIGGRGHQDGQRPGQPRQQAHSVVPSGLARDNHGNTYLADAATHTICKVDRDGQVTTLAGAAHLPAGYDDFIGTDARFNTPRGLAVTSDGGTVYVADWGNDAIRMVRSNGHVLTLDLLGAEGNKVAGELEVHRPAALALDPTGEYLYVAEDSHDGRILRVELSTRRAMILTLAQQLRGGGAGLAVGLDANGEERLFVAQAHSHLILEVPTGRPWQARVLGGVPGVSGHTDGTGDQALFNRPCGLALFPGGFLVVADAGNGAIRVVTTEHAALPAGQVRTVFRSGAPGSGASLNRPEALVQDGPHSLLVADSSTGILRRIEGGDLGQLFASDPARPEPAPESKAPVGTGSPRGVQGTSLPGPATPGADLTGDPAAQPPATGLRDLHLTRDPNAPSAPDPTHGLTDSKRTSPVTPRSIPSPRVLKPGPAPAPQPTLRLTAHAGSVPFGGRVKLDWTPTQPAPENLFLCASLGLNIGPFRLDSQARPELPVRNRTLFALRSTEDGESLAEVEVAARGMDFLAGDFGGLGYRDGYRLGTAWQQPRFHTPIALARDDQGNIYVTDLGAHTLRKINRHGWVTTLAGGAGQEAGHVHGRGTDARFNAPMGLAVAPGGGILYVADSGNDCIRTVHSDGTVGTLELMPAEESKHADQALTLRRPSAVVLDRTGDHLYVAEMGHEGRILRVHLDSRRVTALTLPPGLMSTPFALAVRLDAQGREHLYVADGAGHVILDVPTAQPGNAHVLAGRIADAGDVEGPAAQARFNTPAGLHLDAQGNLLVVDAINRAIRRVTTEAANGTPAGQVETLFRAQASPNDPDAGMVWPCSLVLDGADGLLVADSEGGVLWRINLQPGEGPSLRTWAGTRPARAAHIDGQGPEARFSRPTTITVADNGDAFVVDRANRVIRRVTPAGEVSPWARPTDEVPFRFLSGLTAAPDGTLFATDIGTGIVIQIDARGGVTRYAGSVRAEGEVAAPVVNGPRLAGAQFHGPMDILRLQDGALIVSDGHCLRRIDPKTGLVTTLAGHPDEEGHRNGLGRDARFNSPRGLAQGPDGYIYVADMGNDVIRRVHPDGNEVGTWAGPGDAALARPAALAFGENGWLYVSCRGRSGVFLVNPWDRSIGVLVAGADSLLAGDRGHLHPDGAVPALTARVRAVQGLATTPRGDLLVTVSDNDLVSGGVMQITEPLARIRPDQDPLPPSGPADLFDGDPGRSSTPDRSPSAGHGLETKGSPRFRGFGNSAGRTQPAPAGETIHESKAPVGTDSPRQGPGAPGTGAPKAVEDVPNLALLLDGILDSPGSMLSSGSPGGGSPVPGSPRTGGPDGGPDDRLERERMDWIDAFSRAQLHSGGDETDPLQSEPQPAQAGVPESKLPVAAGSPHPVPDAPPNQARQIPPAPGKGQVRERYSPWLRRVIREAVAHRAQRAQARRLASGAASTPLQPAPTANN